MQTVQTSAISVKFTRQHDATIPKILLFKICGLLKEDTDSYLLKYDGLWAVLQILVTPARLP